MSVTHLAGADVRDTLRQIEQALHHPNGDATPALRAAHDLLLALHHVSTFVQIDHPHQLELLIERACLTTEDDVVLRDLLGRTWVGSPGPGGPVLRRPPTGYETTPCTRALSASCLTLPVTEVSLDAFPMLVLCAPAEATTVLEDLGRTR